MAGILLSPYLNFNGTCEEALNFYKTVFDGEFTVMRFSEMPPMPGMEIAGDKIMHADFKSVNVNFLAADGADDKGITNFQMTLSGTDADALRALFASLAEGGVIGEPLEKAPWGDEFGILTDKFGVKWMVNISAAA